MGARALEYDTTGKMRNILQKIFRILPVVDFLHSAFRILPLPGRERKPGRLY